MTQNTLNTLWVIESHINGKYLPVSVEVSRDSARALQRTMKSSGAIRVKSRIRKYAQDSSSRG